MREQDGLVLEEFRARDHLVEVDVTILPSALDADAIVDEGDLHDQDIRLLRDLIVLDELDRGVTGEDELGVLMLFVDRLPAECGLTDGVPSSALQPGFRRLRRSIRRSPDSTDEMTAAVSPPSACRAASPLRA